MRSFWALRQSVSGIGAGGKPCLGFACERGPKKCYIQITVGHFEKDLALNVLQNEMRRVISLFYMKKSRTFSGEILQKAI